jgi:hypothetical protein
MSAERPMSAGPRWVGEDQGLPGEFLAGFTEGLMDRREQLLRDGHPPDIAREQAVAEAVQAFTTDADQRDWTVSEPRIAGLADEALGLEEEYRDRHGYEPELARLFAVGEVLEGERAREDLPSSWLRPVDPPGPDPARRQRQPSKRTRPDGRTDRVWTRAAGHER